MDPNQGSSQPGQNGLKKHRLAGRSIVFAAAIVVALVSGTAVAAVRLRDDRGTASGPVPTAPTVGSPTTTALPPGTTTVPPTTTTAPKPKPKLRPKAKPAPKLGPGVQSHAVLVVQRRLVELGYADLTEATGHFDSATTSAVLAFQKVNGLGRDGVVGKNTWKALRAEPKRPAAKSRDKGFHIETDLTKQVTYLVTDGRIEGMINISSASGAVYEVEGDVRRAITPTGTFKIRRKIPAWRKSKLGLLYRPAYFTGGYAYHGAYSVPGWPASHGCIRMAISTMDRMYDRFEVGTPVHIYRT